MTRHFATALLLIGLSYTASPAQQPDGEPTKAEKRAIAMKRIVELKAKLAKIDGELYAPEEKKDSDDPPKIPKEDPRRRKELEAERTATLAALDAALKALPVETTREANARILKTLQQPIETGRFEDVPLKDVLASFSEGADLPIVVDREAFLLELGAEAPDPGTERVTLPKLPRMMTMSLALRLTLQQVGKGKAIYVIRQGHVEIVTRKYVQAGHLLSQSLLLTAFENRPLHEVLRDFTEETGLTINIDPNVGEKMNKMISATFRNASLEDALVTVTEMSDLKFVVLERSVFVTTPDRVEAIRKEEKERSQNRN